MSKQRKVSKGIRLDVVQISAVKGLAKKCKVSFSDFVRRAIDEQIKKGGGVK